MRWVPLHWKEYAAEALGLGLFMAATCGYASLLVHPDSPIAQSIPSEPVQRFMMSVAIALTVVGMCRSPWGRRSGAHLNPAMTLTFYRMGRISGRDAGGYILSQLTGGLLGVGIAGLVLGPWLEHPDVQYAATVPGRWGEGAAWAAEFAMTFLLMSVVLWVSSHGKWSNRTPWAAALCVFLFINFEAPVSGMSLNPARTLASAVAAAETSGLWIYFTAPLAGMLAAAELRRVLVRDGGHACAKMDHDPRYPCLFCDFRKARSQSRPRHSPVAAYAPDGKLDPGQGSAKLAEPGSR